MEDMASDNDLLAMAPILETVTILPETGASSTPSVNHGHWSAVAVVSHFSGSHDKSPFRT
jgi:hypothetical protein